MSNPIEDYVRQRVGRQNKNFLCAVTGPTGSGKTYSALRFGEVLDPDFHAGRVVFTPAEFMTLINSGDLSSGSVVVFDEAGVTLNNREWQSKSNRLINFVAQTFRHRNYIVVFTSPSFDFVDVALRKLFHAVYETVGIDYKRSVCTVKPLFIQVNQRTGKMYYKYLKRRDSENRLIKVTRYGLRLPSRKLRDAYEEKKLAFTTKLNDSVMQELAPQVMSRSQILVGRKLTTQQSRALFLRLAFGLSETRIGGVLGVTRQAAHNLLMGARRNGWDFPSNAKELQLADEIPQDDSLRLQAGNMTDKLLRAALADLQKESE